MRERFCLLVVCFIVEVMSNVRYKYCIVPQCKNTTFKTPNKLFFSVPAGEEVRKKWCSAVGRVPGVHRTLSVKCTRFVCEDHFDLEKDMKNYQMWKLVGVGKLMLKKGILPHKFKCQGKDNEVEKNISSQNVRRGLKDYNRCHEIYEIKDQDLYAAQRKRQDKIISRNIYDALDIDIKEEKLQDDICEQKTSIVSNDKVMSVDNILGVIKFDPETGGEYLIKVDRTNRIKAQN